LTHKKCNFARVRKESLPHNLGNLSLRLVSLWLRERRLPDYGKTKQAGLPGCNCEAVSISRQEREAEYLGYITNSKSYTRNSKVSKIIDLIEN
jgi:hypothetical protein